MRLAVNTLLGVCEGIGQDFGFNPLFLRVALAATILWDPKVAFGAYFLLGLLVAASRLLFPDKPVAMPQVEAPALPSAAEVANEPEVVLAEAA